MYIAVKKMIDNNNVISMEMKWGPFERQYYCEITPLNSIYE